MGVAILLRKNMTYSLFREFLLAALEEIPKAFKNEKLKFYLLSPYITESKNGYSILNDQLQNSIKQAKACKNTDFVFFSNKYEYTNQYKNHNFIEFFKKLALINKIVSKNNFYWLHNNTNTNINIFWHAKLFITTKNDKPIFTIIGSSNLTAPAYSFENNKNDNRLKPQWFNIEADVLIWTRKIDKYKVVSEIRKKVYANLHKQKVEVPPIIWTDDIEDLYTVDNALNDLFNKVKTLLKPENRVSNDIRGGDYDSTKV